MRKTALFAVSAILLTGCATALSAKDYSRGTANPSQFDRDSASCEMEGAKAGKDYRPGGGEFESVYDSVYDPCMRAKGYSRIK